MFDLVCFGSATLDAFVETEKQHVSREGAENFIAYKSGEKILISDLHFEVGGGGTNTSACASRLGLRTGYCGMIGSDANGQLVLRALAADGVSFLGAATADQQTNYSVVLDSTLLHDRTILVYKGASEHLTQDAVRQFDTSWVYTASLAGESFKTLIAVLEVLTASGVKVAANPSSYQIEHDKDDVFTLLRLADIVVMNREEARLLVNGATEKDMLKRLQSLGPRTAIITAGKDGVFAGVNDLYLTAKPAPKKVVETTGAGDCFASTFVAATILGMPPRDALRWALVNVESLISTVGAKKGLLTRHELEHAVSADTREITEL